MKAHLKLRTRGALYFSLILGFSTGCEVWYPPLATRNELSTGLVVLYPGSFNTVTEMQGFYDGLRKAELKEAIQVMRWAPFLEHMFDPPNALTRQRERAKVEALRLAEYKSRYADCPITLLGYSGGCLMAVLAAEEMPEGVLIDRVILMSAAMSKDYDLTAALAKTRLGVVHHWSHRELFTIRIAQDFSLADGTHGDPASSFGFAKSDERLTQINWIPEWEVYGYHGEHWEYLFATDWIRDFVAPWVVDPHGS